MIIGNGMIARSMNKYKNDENVLIFASGISNSLEENDLEYDREFELLKKNIKNRKVIYFSTISIFDPSLDNSKYIIHKRKVEKHIRENCKSFLIFRLPIVIGITVNKNTLFNYFKGLLLEDKEVKVKEMAYRYIIDIDDIKEELPFFIENFNNETVNVTFNNKESVYNIACYMKNVLNSSSKISISPTKIQSNYIIDNCLFCENASEKDKNYNDIILKKYLT